MIPKLHYISQGKSPQQHLEQIQRACNSGAELIQIALGAVPEKKILALVKEARQITSHFQTRLILEGHYKIARETKADGVFLSTADTCPTKVRIHLYTWQTIAGEAHTLEECQELLAKQVDYIVLGPYKRQEAVEIETRTLGIDGYTVLIEALGTETPILATGGIETTDVHALLDAGVSGIAVSQAIAKDVNTIKTFNKLLKASSTQEQRHTF